MRQCLEKSRELISEGKTKEAIEMLSAYLDRETEYRDEAFYLLGNAYRKAGNWKEAIQNYMEATELNPESPAAEARRMMNDILDFYDKNMYNQ